MAPKKTSKSSLQKDGMDIAEKFQSLHDKAVLFGLKSSDFLNLTTLRQISQERSTNSKLRAFLILVLCFLLLNQALEYPVCFINFVALALGGPLATMVRCVVSQTDATYRLFRPPITDCSFCKNKTNIPKLSNISTKYFYETFSELKHPVVIVDAMEKWDARRKFDYSFLKKLYLKQGTKSLETDAGSGKFLPFKGDFDNLKQVFERIDEETLLLDGVDPWYIGWGDEDFETQDAMRQFYGRPYFLKDTSEALTWIFMGSPGYGATKHIDSVESPSWQGQLKGKKIWTLEPPPECFFECRAISLDVTVNEGEMILLETNFWYHRTLNIGDEISISIGAEYD